LKDILTSEPILKIVDPYDDFVVCIDACKEGLSGFLTKKYHVICYESRKIKIALRGIMLHMIWN
jgi:hypothetical protein